MDIMKKEKLLLLVPILSITTAFFLSGFPWPTFFAMVSLFAILSTLITGLNPNYIFSLLLIVTIIPFGTGSKPISSFRLSGLPLSIHDVFFVSIMILFIVAQIRDSINPGLSQKTPGVHRKSNSSYCLLPLKYFAILGIWSLIVGILNGNNLWDIGRDVLALSYLSMAFVVFYFLDTVPKVLKAFKLIMIGTIVYAMTMVFSFIAGEHFVLTKPLVDYYSFARMYYQNSNIYLLLLPYLIASFLIKRYNQSLTFILILLTLMAIILTMTIGLIIGSIISSLFALLLFYRRAKSAIGITNKLLVLTSAAIILFLIASSFTPAVNELSKNFISKISSTARVIRTTEKGRMYSYILAWEKVNNSKTMLIGSGLGTLFVIPWANFRGARAQYFQPGVDNVALTLIGKMGILGALIFYWILWRLFKSGLIISLNSDRKDLIVVGITISAAMTGILVASISQAYMIFSEFGIIFGCLLGVSERLLINLNLRPGGLTTIGGRND